MYSVNIRDLLIRDLPQSGAERDEWASWRSANAPAIVAELATTSLGEELLETNRRPFEPGKLGTERQK